MTTIEKLKSQLQAMLDKTETREDIEQIGITNSLADTLEAEHLDLQNKYDALFKDYRELVKHTSFAPNGKENNETGDTTPPSFGEFLANYRK